MEKTMIPSWLFYITPLLLSCLLAWFFTKLVRLIALHREIVDKPAPRKVHDKPVPLLGGLAVGGAILIAMIVLWPWLHDGVIVSKYLYGIIIGLCLLLLGGYLDDVYNLRPWQQIIFPLLASIIVVLSGIGIDYVTNPLGPGYWHFDQYKILLLWYHGLPYYFTPLADIFTLLWLMGMVYVTKLLDGLDGLASGIGVIGSLVIFIVSLTWDVAYSATSVLALLTAGALLGFLWWNWHPAKIFLGEGGSTLVGFMLGILAIISGGKIATALLIMGIPILDVAWVIMRRLLVERHSIAQADRQHLHHRLLSVGLSHRGAVIFLFIITAGFGLMSIWQNTKGKIITLLFLVVFMVFLAYSLVRRQERLK
ncbi:MAG: glycosyltransferase family 4 protein [Candidatus Komeilibacteria bacterium]